MSSGLGKGLLAAFPVLLVNINKNSSQNHNNESYKCGIEKPP